MDQRTLRTIDTFERVLIFLAQEKPDPTPPLLTQKQLELAESVDRRARCTRCICLNLERA